MAVGGGDAVGEGDSALIGVDDVYYIEREKGSPLIRLIAVDPHFPDPALIAEAAAVLRGGGLVAFPTETVYGLGADAMNPTAVARIFTAKGRPAEDPIIVHVLGFEALAELAASVPPVAARLASEFWPGPLTLVVPRDPRVPAIVTAGLDSVAVRAPAHPVARALLAAVGGPIAAPSANPFGRTSPTTAAHVVADLGERIDLVLDGGPAEVGVESTVVDCCTDPPVLLRPGGVTIEALRAVVPNLRRDSARVEVGGPVEPEPPIPSKGETRPTTAQRSPGLLDRHYAPRATLVLIAGPPEDVRAVLRLATMRLVEGGRHVGVLVAEEDAAAIGESYPGRVEVLVLGSLRDPAEPARHLFGALRELDAAGVEVILARDFGDKGLGLAIRDRLTRAAEGRVVRVAAGGAEEALEAVVAWLVERS